MHPLCLGFWWILRRKKKGKKQGQKVKARGSGADGLVQLVQAFNSAVKVFRTGRSVKEVTRSPMVQNVRDAENSVHKINDILMQYVNNQRLMQRSMMNQVSKF